MVNDNKMYVREALFETIQNQIDKNNPKETKSTYDRLIREGRHHDDAMRLLRMELIRTTASSFFFIATSTAAFPRFAARIWA